MGAVLLVAAVAASAYGIGRVTREEDSLAREPAAARSDAAQRDARSHASERSSRKASTRAKRREREARRSGKRSERKDRAAAKVDRAGVTVAVLNGTTIAGLASTVATRLTAAGFAPGGVGDDTANQARTRSAIFYLPGKRSAAREVARVLELSRNAVRPIAQAEQQAVDPGVDVVVTVGSRAAR